MERQYSLWGIPERPVREILQGFIDRQATMHGTPRFTPHVTILGDTTLEEIARIRLQDAYTIRFNNVRTGDAWHNTVYLRAERSAETMRAREPFYDPAYNPHLSLIYAIHGCTLHDKEQIVREAGPLLPLLAKIDRVWTVQMVAAGEFTFIAERPLIRPSDGRQR